MTKGWLNEFSQMGLELLRETSLNAHTKQLKERRRGQTTDSISAISRAPSLNTIVDYIEEHKDALSQADHIDFNTLAFCRELGRKSALSVLTIHVL